MTSLPLRPASAALHLSARAAVVTGLYVAAAVAVLLTVIILRPIAAPATLSRFLGFILVASLAAGLEPGTVKAAALREAGVGGASTAAYLVAGAVKALAAAPALALVWWFADPAVPATTLAWTPALAVAGFCATDLRARLDLGGRYAMALAAKQASLAGGFVLAGGLVAIGVPLSGAVGVSCLARLAVVALVANQADRMDGSERIGRGTIGSQVAGLLRDRRWIDLAAVSVIAAAGGGADRLFGLRYLAPAAYGSYFLTSELFSRFWLIPYILSPILFARRAAGPADDGFARAAWGLVAIAGAVFLAATAGLIVLAPGLLRHLLGGDLGLAVLAFAAAVVVNSFSQLRVAELQGAGRSGLAALATAFGAVIAAPLFLVAALHFGGAGLLFAWLAKSALELAILMAGGTVTARKRGDGVAEPRR